MSLAERLPVFGAALKDGGIGLNCLSDEDSGFVGHQRAARPAARGLTARYTYPNRAVATNKTESTLRVIATTKVTVSNMPVLQEGRERTGVLITGKCLGPYGDGKACPRMGR
jgi:hypothetical protein